MTLESRGGSVIWNPLNVLGSLWMKGACWMWHFMKLKENHFLLKQLWRLCRPKGCLEAVWMPPSPGLFGKHLEMKLFMEAFFSLRAFCCKEKKKGQPFSNGNLCYVKCTNGILLFHGTEFNFLYKIIQLTQTKDIQTSPSLPLPKSTQLSP